MIGSVIYLFVGCPRAPWLHDRELEDNDGVPCRSERTDGIKVTTGNVFHLVTSLAVWIFLCQFRNVTAQFTCIATPVVHVPEAIL
jgi:hypothetical protein